MQGRVKAHTFFHIRSTSDDDNDRVAEISPRRSGFTRDVQGGATVTAQVLLLRLQCADAGSWLMGGGLC